MKKTIMLVGLILMVISTTSAQYHGSQTVSLDVNIKQLNSSKGAIAIQLLNGNNQRVASAYANINEGKSKITFNYLKPGKYAVRYYHDENRNGQMETNMIGIPTEGYGFSNNAFSPFGPPDFENMLFPVTKNTSIDIYTRY